MTAFRELIADQGREEGEWVKTGHFPREARWIPYSHRFRVEDPRDHIYANLGAKVAPLVINYEVDVIKVYSEFTKTLSMRYGIMFILKYRCGPGAEVDGKILPLWVPNWSDLEHTDYFDSDLWSTTAALLKAQQRISLLNLDFGDLDVKLQGRHLGRLSTTVAKHRLCQWQIMSHQPIEFQPAPTRAESSRVHALTEFHVASDETQWPITSVVTLPSSNENDLVVGLKDSPLAAILRHAPAGNDKFWFIGFAFVRYEDKSNFTALWRTETRVEPQTFCLV